MVVFTPIPGLTTPIQENTGTRTDVQAFIQAAEQADISSLTTTDATSTVSVDTTVLPQNLQTEIAGCDSTDTCKYVAYNFDSQQVIPHVNSNLAYTVDLKPGSKPNVGIFMKNTADDPVVLKTLPTYDVHLDSYTGTPLQTITDTITPTPETCASRCDSVDQCEGFNYNDLENTCSLFAPGNSKTYSNPGTTSFSKINLLNGNPWRYIRGASNEFQSSSYRCAVPNVNTGECLAWSNTLYTYVFTPNFDFWSVFQREIDACNRTLSNLISTGDMKEFYTKSLPACKNLPNRYYNRTSATSYKLYDENGGIQNITRMTPFPATNPYRDIYTLLSFKSDPVTFSYADWKSDVWLRGGPLPSREVRWTYYPGEPGLYTQMPACLSSGTCDVWDNVVSSDINRCNVALDTLLHNQIHTTEFFSNNLIECDQLPTRYLKKLSATAFQLVDEKGGSQTITRQTPFPASRPYDDVYKLFHYDNTATMLTWQLPVSIVDEWVSTVPAGRSGWSFPYYDWISSNWTLGTPSTSTRRWDYYPGQAGYDKLYTCKHTSSVTNQCDQWQNVDTNQITSTLPVGFTTWDATVTRDYINKCNVILWTLITQTNTTEFFTQNIKDCAKLPNRYLKKISATSFILNDEYGGVLNRSNKGDTNSDIYDLLHFGSDPIVYPPNKYVIGKDAYGKYALLTALNGLDYSACPAGQRTTYFGCKNCSLALNSYWAPNTNGRVCAQIRCPTSRILDTSYDHFSEETWISAFRIADMPASDPNLNILPGDPYYCRKSTNGYLVYTYGNGTTYEVPCVNTPSTGQTYNSVGSYSSSTQICPLKSCSGSVTTVRYDKEIYSGSMCQKSVCPYGTVANQATNVCDVCPVGLGPRQFFLNPKTCDTCSVPIGYDRVPASGTMTYYSNGNPYTYRVDSPGALGYPEYGCKATLCSRTPDVTKYEIWDTANSNLCAIQTCPLNYVPNATQTGCDPLPGFETLCHLDSDCVCDAGSSKNYTTGMCSECSTKPSKGFEFKNMYYLGGNDFCITGRCTNTLSSSQVWSVDCTTRTCFATTTPSVDGLSCTRCSTEPYNSGMTRYGYLSTVSGGGIYGALADPVIGGSLLTGCTLGVCPAPQSTPDACEGGWTDNGDGSTCWQASAGTSVRSCPNGGTLSGVVCLKNRPIKRWKYGRGCDWIQCPRAPKTTLPTSATSSERWAGEFGCDIVTWTYAIGQTTCTTFPSAGNKWTNTYGCGISTCTSPTLINGQIWGPGCTTRDLVAWDDTPNPSNTYFLKCTNWPDPGQQFGTQPCSVVPCNFTPQRGYIWNVSDSQCGTIKCPNYTYPDSTNSRCLPCPADTVTGRTSSNYGKYGYTKDVANLCRIKGCSDTTGRTLAGNEYWTTGTTCSSTSICPVGSEVINTWKCSSCSNSPNVQGSNNIWSTLGRCWTSPCGKAQQPNATNTACTACPATPAFGYTYADMGCTFVACSAIASSNIWTTAGACESTACTEHTQPNASKSSCVSCSSPGYGFIWTAIDGCGIQACPAIASSNIWTAAGTCSNVACTGHTQPNAAKSLCDSCPSPGYGFIWTATDGCATSACPAIPSSNIWTNIGTCDNSACTGHSLPDATKTSCQDCSIQYGYRWTTTNGCATQVCSALAATYIWAELGTCNSTACTGHTQPDASKTVCETCTLPSWGNTWSSTTGCAIKACSALSSTKIWTSQGTCSSSSCPGHTQPDTSKTSCVLCPSPSYGSAWSGTSGCNTSVCPDIQPGTKYPSDGSSCTSIPCDTPRLSMSTTWDQADTRGACRYICNAPPGISTNSNCIIDGSRCLPPNPGYMYSVGCYTTPCMQTPALGYFWDPSGGCAIFSCTQEFGISPGPDEIWAGTGCIIVNCPLGTKKVNGVCQAICDVTGITLPTNSIYAARTDSAVVQMCPPYSSPAVVGDWSNSGGDCSVALTPGNSYEISTCITNTQQYSNACDPFNLRDQETQNCTMYATAGTSILIGTSVANGQLLSGDVYMYLYYGTSPSNETLVSYGNVIASTITATGTYTLVQKCFGQTCQGQTGYFGTASAKDIPYVSTGYMITLWGSTDADYREIFPDVCPNNPPFYDGRTAVFSVPLESSGDYTVVIQSYETSINGQLTITNSNKYCSVQLCTGRRQPDVTATACQACSTLTMSPGITWTSADGCTTTACTNLTYGNTWLTTDTSGMCSVQACSPSLGAANYWSAISPTCPQATCAKGTTVNATKTGCDTCSAIASNNIFTTNGSCANTACTGRTQPDSTKTVCQTCTCPPGQKWSSTSGCATTACTTTLPYGYVWDPNDTNGACSQVSCSNWNYIIPGKRLGAGSCTLNSCTGLTGGNGWDPTYDTFSSTCRQAPITFVVRVALPLQTGSTKRLAWLYPESNGKLSLRVNSGVGTAYLSISSWATTTPSPALQTGFTHIRLREYSTTTDRYFFISSPYSLTDTFLYGYMIDQTTNLEIARWFGGIQAYLDYTLYFGTMCPSPFSATGGQYLTKPNTCTTTAACTTLATYGQYYPYPGVACDLGTCGTIAANQYYTATGSCTAFSNCTALAGGMEYSTATRNNLSVCPASVNCTTLASYGQYYLYPGINCNIGTCTVPVNQYYTTTGSCSGSKSNCSPIAQGFMYSSSRPSGLSVCSSIVACPTALSGTNGWVTDTLGTGTCAQKVLTWTQTGTISVPPFAQGTLQVTPATPTATDMHRNCAISSSVLDLSGTQPLQTVSQWASGFPVSTAGHTHIRFPFNMGSGSTEWTFQVSTPYTGTDKYIYGYFVGTSTNARVDPYTRGSQGFVGTNTFKFGKYS